ncbi:MAG: GIY-YIG nuclease family protein [Gammaproteobacteria bacterium]|nr:GIY-YIG nuclease family protein [Gammaproteobacteria bacterium]
MVSMEKQKNSDHSLDVKLTDTNSGNDLVNSHIELPLTPAIIKKLIFELFAGHLVQRQKIINEVTRIHLSRGGTLGRTKSITNSFKKALNNMLREGHAENPTLGHWRILEQNYQQSKSLLLATTISSVSQVTEGISQPRIAAEKTFGDGSGAIYLYYLPTYRDHAQQHGKSVWPCKIGRSNRDPLERVMNQIATALPEQPVIDFILRTPNPHAWEKAIHSILTIRGLNMKDSPGTEWFLTSPEEVISLMKLFDPTLFNSN